MTKFKKIIVTVCLIVIAALSATAGTKYFSSPKAYSGVIETLDEKRTTVLALTAASTSASVAITLSPDDTATPIAEKLADLSSIFLIILSAIYLEKYALTIIGYLTFRILIPIVCAAIALYVFLEKESLKRLAIKLALFGAVIFLVVPTSVKISNMIEDTYQTSIEETMNAAENMSSEDEEKDEEDSKGVSGLLSGIKDTVSEAITSAADTAKNILNQFIEALAVLIVTSCLIPVLVILFFVWVVKLLFNLEIPLPSADTFSKKRKKLEGKAIEGKEE